MRPEGLPILPLCQDFIANGKKYHEVFEQCWERVSMEPEWAGMEEPNLDFMPIDYSREGMNRYGQACYNSKWNAVILNEIKVNLPVEDKCELVRDVFYHELCHMIYPKGHPREFWLLLQRFDPRALEKWKRYYTLEQRMQEKNPVLHARCPQGVDIPDEYML